MTRIDCQKVGKLLQELGVLERETSIISIIQMASNTTPSLSYYGISRMLGKKHRSKELRSMDKQSDIVVRKIAADNLPPGWIKEIRTRKKGGKTRRDPMTGTNRERLNRRLITKKATGNKRLASEPDLAACSKGTATSNDLEQRAKVDNSQAVEIYDKLQPVNTVEEHEDMKEEIKNSPDSEADKNADRDQSLNLGSTDTRMEKKAWKVPNKSPPAIEMEGGIIEDKRLTVNHVESFVVRDQTLQSESGRFPVKIGFKTEVDGLEEGEKEDSSFLVLQDSPPEVNKNDKKLGHKNKRKRLTNKNKLPRRTSKRFTCAESDSTPQVKTRNNEACDAETYSAEKAVSFDPAKEHSMKWIRENPTNNKLKDLDMLPSRDDEKFGVHLDSSLKDLLMDPCIEFAIKTLSGVIPIEDINEAKDCPVPSNPSPHQISDSGFSSVMTPGDLWSDPCFEFAVKTLKGEIPMESSSDARGSFEQSSSSSRSSYFNSPSLPQFMLNSFCPSSYLHK